MVLIGSNRCIRPYYKVVADLGCQSYVLANGKA